jgi:hypothetical protein
MYGLRWPNPSRLIRSEIGPPRNFRMNGTRARLWTFAVASAETPEACMKIWLKLKK